MCGLCEWSQPGAVGFLGLWKGQEGPRTLPGEGAGLLEPPIIPLHTSVSGSLHSLFWKSLNTPAGASPWKPFLSLPSCCAFLGALLPCWAFSILQQPSSLGSGALTRPFSISVHFPCVCIPPSQPSSKPEPQIAYCVLDFCTWCFSDSSLLPNHAREPTSHPRLLSLSEQRPHPPGKGPTLLPTVALCAVFSSPRCLHLGTCAREPEHCFVVCCPY